MFHAADLNKRYCQSPGLSRMMINLEDLAVLSSYLTARMQRFGVYATDVGFTD